MTNSEQHARSRSAAEAVVAAYAGQISGCSEFELALAVLRERLPHARVYALVPDGLWNRPPAARCGDVPSCSGGTAPADDGAPDAEAPVNAALLADAAAAQQQFALDAAYLIEYPTPHVDIDRADAPACEVAPGRGDAARARRSVRGVVAALERLSAAAAVVFTERGHAPYTPAYLCYLAGIPHRVGFESEFAGGVLSEAIPASKATDDVARHVALLTAAKLEGIVAAAAERRIDRGSRRCAV